METSKVTIREVLCNAEQFEWSDALFLPDTITWTLETQGIVWDPDDVESDDDEVPKTAEENGLLCSMDIQTIQGIVQNAKQQTGSCSEEQLFEAFLYYWDNDAYICLERD